MNPLIQQDGSEEIMKSLFRDAMESNWKEVIKTYEKNKESHTAKITSSGDTALHIAISNDEESVVEALVALCKTTGGAFQTQNVFGNTPLHLAANLGNARMCRCIAACDSTLMGIRNLDNETPFFLAVRRGNKEAFHALHLLCKPLEGYAYCRGKDGETILHSAINGEYFDLAFDIMSRYDMLMNAVDEHDFSPLHILANKPSAFRSGSQIRGLDKLIYHCIFVDELPHKTMHNQAADHQYKEGSNYPENHHTCVTAFYKLWDVFRVLPDEKHDEENIKERKQREETQINSRQQDENHPKAEGSIKRNAQGHEFLPMNYSTFFNFVKLISKTIFLVILGLVGSKSVNEIKEKKAKHIWSVQIMDKLLDNASSYQYEYNGRSPGIIPQGKDSKTLIPYTLPDMATGITVPQGEDSETITPYTLPDMATAGAADFNDIAHEDRHEMPEPPPEKPANSKAERASTGKTLEMEKEETPILIAAKRGVMEMVEGILERFPVAIHDVNSDGKNVVLLAAEHRQPRVYKFLLDWSRMMDTIFGKTDENGNSALHLAARLGEFGVLSISGAVLQMQWEVKWYEFVKKSMPLNFFPRYNNEFKTPMDIFSDTHDALVKEGGAWLTSTSQSCSVVGALIASVTFATSATVPGGVKSDNSGTPTLQNEPAFSIFAISSVVALCFSVTSVLMFLAILISRFQVKDFGKDLPRKLLVGLTSLFISIVSMQLCFCAGHFFMLKENLLNVALPMYAITCLPITFFAINQFPLYLDLLQWATMYL